MYQYRQVILHMRLGESDRAVSRSGLVSRTKAHEIRAVAILQGWLDTNEELPDDATLSKFFTQRAAKQSTEPLAKRYEAEIRQWVQQGIQATTIHQALIRKYGYTGAYNSVQRYVKGVRGNQVHATTALDFAPADSAQVDFGQGPQITDVRTGETIKTWIFVMVLSWSRHQYAEIVPNQKMETWLACHRRAFEFFNGVPLRVIIDNPKCAITKACYHDPQVQRAYGEYAQGYGFLISACPPREPKKKGRVESGVKYVKKNFVPLRTFRSLSDANAQLKQWILETAGNRIHGSTREKPLNRFQETEKFLLKSLPLQPPEISVWQKVKVHGDCHVQFEKRRYSVPYTWIKQSVWLRANETMVQIYHNHEIIAIHPRLKKPGERHTINEHLPPNAVAYAMRDPQWCLRQSQAVGPHCHKLIKKLFSDKVLDRLRAAQGILSLKKNYGSMRLEAACQRALAFYTIEYRAVKQILQAGLEYEAIPEAEAFDTLSETYTGKGRYSRNTRTLLQ